MPFVLRMAWRETRASWVRLIFFFVCVAVGVAAIMALRSVIQNVRDVMTREARGLIAADLLVESNRPLTAEQQAIIEEAAGGVAASRASVAQTFTMIRPAAADAATGARLAEVRGVDAAYPLYGSMTLESGRAYSPAMLRDRGAIVQPEVLAQLGLGVGDPIVIAGQAFTIRDVLAAESAQRRGGISFGPRLYVSLDDMRALPVFGLGSRVTYSQMFAVPDDRQLAVAETRLREAFRRTPVNAISWKRLEDRIGTALATGENYLSLIGFAVVVLGGIGVWSVTRVFVQQKLKTIAVLKCVGASSRAVTGIFVSEIVALSLVGCLVGALLASLALAAIPAGTLTALRVPAVHLTASAALQGSLVGVLVSVLFATVPLLEVGQVKPLLLLRADTAPTSRRPTRSSVIVAMVVGAAVVAVAMWQAGSVRAGAMVSAGGVIAVAVLQIAGRLVIAATRPLASSTRFALRHAVVSLRRPGGQARVVLMAVGLGAFFVLGMRLVQANLLAEFAPASGRSSPDLVLIDVQPDQAAGITAISTETGAAPPRFVPMFRARITGVSGGLDLPTTRDVQEYGNGLTREFGLTFRDHLDDNETIVAGRLWTGPSAGTLDGELEVSVEQNLQRNAGLALGDVVRFDVGGRSLRARITSVRRVEWDNVANGGFVFVFQPGAIERVPFSYVTFVTGLETAQARAGFQRALSERFPNVSAIDVREILRGVQDILGNVTLAVTVVGAVLLGAGVLILVGAVSMTKFQRLYDAAIYRTLGASRGRLMAMVAIEYGLLGALAGIVGAAGALSLSFVLCRFFLDVSWSPQLPLVGGGVAATAALVSAVGLAASIDVLVRKPLRTLRSE
jgi:putative ABC transport system permease protein